MTKYLPPTPLFQCHTLIMCVSFYVMSLQSQTAFDVHKGPWCMMKLTAMMGAGMCTCAESQRFQFNLLGVSVYFRSKGRQCVCNMLQIDLNNNTKPTKMLTISSHTPLTHTLTHTGVIQEESQLIVLFYRHYIKTKSCSPPANPPYAYNHLLQML